MGNSISKIFSNEKIKEDSLINIKKRKREDEKKNEDNKINKKIKEIKGDFKDIFETSFLGEENINKKLSDFKENIKKNEKIKNKEKEYFQRREYINIYNKCLKKTNELFEKKILKMNNIIIDFYDYYESIFERKYKDEIENYVIFMDIPKNDIILGVILDYIKKNKMNMSDINSIELKFFHNVNFLLLEQIFKENENIKQLIFHSNFKNEKIEGLSTFIKNSNLNNLKIINECDRIIDFKFNMKTYSIKKIKFLKYESYEYEFNNFLMNNIKYNNNIETFEFKKGIINTNIIHNISSFYNLKELNLSYTKINDSEMLYLSENITKFLKLEKICLAECFFEIKIGKNFFSNLLKMNIKILNLKYCLFENEKNSSIPKYLNNFLISTKSLNTFMFGGWQLYDNKNIFLEFNELYMNNKNIKNISYFDSFFNIEKYIINNQSVNKGFFEKIGNNNTIEEITLNPFINLKNLKILLNSLNNNSKLKTIILKGGYNLDGINDVLKFISKKNRDYKFKIKNGINKVMYCFDKTILYYNIKKLYEEKKSNSKDDIEIFYNDEESHYNKLDKNNIISLITKLTHFVKNNIDYYNFDYMYKLIIDIITLNDIKIDYIFMSQISNYLLEKIHKINEDFFKKKLKDSKKIKKFKDIYFNFNE